MEDTKKRNDEELVKCYIAGDESAFEVLVKKYRKVIYQKIYFIIRDRVVAEDILQETFFKIIRSIRSGVYDEQGRFLSWAVTVARNQCLDYKRKLKGPKLLPYELMPSQCFFQHSTTMKCRISESQLQQQIQFIVNQLPEVQRTVIKYRHFEEMSFKEISLAMDTNVSTTTRRMRYGLKNLYKIIKDREIDFR